MKTSLGCRIGDPKFDPQADLNSDGIVNALDIALLRLGRSSALDKPRMTDEARPGAGLATTVLGERIVVEGQTTFALPGTTVSVLFLIRENTTPILSYTLDVNIIPQSGSVGTVTADVSMTNFYDVRNLMTAGGAMRDPFFSVVQDNGSGGVSVTTITSDRSTVQAVDNVNDVLAQVFFDVPKDALGDFAIELASGSVLVDGDAASIPFAYYPGMIRVTNSIPAVSDWGMALLVVSVVTAASFVFLGQCDFARSEARDC